MGDLGLQVLWLLESQGNIENYRNGICVFTGGRAVWRLLIPPKVQRPSDTILPRFAWHLCYAAALGETSFETRGGFRVFTGVLLWRFVMKLSGEARELLGSSHPGIMLQRQMDSCGASSVVLLQPLFKLHALADEVLS